jgi:protein SCO1/2
VLKLDAGEDFDVIAVSIDPGETPAMAAETKAAAVDRYDRPETAAGWHFLTGDEESIRTLTDAAGFSYVYEPDTDEYAHTSGIVIVRPDGVISQYYFGIEYPPKDVRLALVEAGDGKVGSIVDQLLLYCFRYDPALGKYTAAIMRVLRLAGFVFALGLSFFLLVMWRRERRLATLGAASP